MESQRDRERLGRYGNIEGESERSRDRDGKKIERYEKMGRGRER